MSKEKFGYNWGVFMVSVLTGYAILSYLGVVY